MPSQPSFPTDFRAIKSLERKYKGKTTRPVDQSKLRVKVKPTEEELSAEGYRRGGLVAAPMFGR